MEEENGRKKRGSWEEDLGGLRCLNWIFQGDASHFIHLLGIGETRVSRNTKAVYYH